MEGKVWQMKQVERERKYSKRKKCSSGEIKERNGD